MTENHPSFGPVPLEAFQKARQSPYGEAAKIIRKYAPSFQKGGAEKDFCIEVERTVMHTETAKIRVSATSEEEAEKFVRDMDEHDFDWSDNCDSRTEYFSIQQIKEAS